MVSDAAEQLAAAPRRGRPRSNEAREAILAATLAVACEQGYSRLSHETVAARAGTGKATVYRWWPSKAQLVVAALRHHAPPAAALEPTGDTRTDVQNLITDTMSTIAVHGHLIAAVAPDAADDPIAAAELAAYLGPRRANHAAVLLAAGGRGELPHDIHTRLILDMIAGTIMYRRLFDPRSDDDAALVGQLTDLVCDGRLPRTT